MNMDKKILIEKIKQQNLKTEAITIPGKISNDPCVYRCLEDLNLLDTGIEDLNNYIIEGGSFNQTFYRSMLSDSITLAKSTISEYLYKNISNMILDFINTCIKPGDFSTNDLNELIETALSSSANSRLYISSFISGANTTDLINTISSIVGNMDESKDLEVDYMAGNLFSSIIVFVNNIALHLDCAIHNMVGKKYLTNSANQKFKSAEEFIDAYLGELYEFNICNFRSRIVNLLLYTLKVVENCKISAKQNLLYPTYDEYDR